MQSITTGFSMEIFFTILVGVEIFLILCLNVFIVKKVMCLEISALGREQSLINNLHTVNELNRSLLARSNSDNAKPMKSNNWDSVKNCFKGPSRVEVNERN